MSRRSADDHEERLNALLLDYVEKAQAGQAPDRERVLRAHPEFRRELDEFFAGNDEIARLAAPLRKKLSAGQGTNNDLRSAVERGSRSGDSADCGLLGDYRLL